MVETSSRYKIKECPVCHSRSFSDMDTCYSCLHRFSDDVEASLTTSFVNGVALVKDNDSKSSMLLPNSINSSIENGQSACIAEASLNTFTGNSAIEEASGSRNAALLKDDIKQSFGTLNTNNIPGFSTVSTVMLSSGEQVAVKIDVQIL